jgi:outer membrane protein
MINLQTAMKKTLVLTVGLLLSWSAILSAQKFGYANSVALLSQLPEVKQADSDLKAFQTQLNKKGQEMVAELQQKAESLQRKQDQGTISPKDYETQAAVLQTEQDSIGKYEQEVYAKIAEKREELFKPILEKVNKAMTDVAKENGYQMIFDTSTQILLYADETLDVTALVKAKLGIK